MRARQSPNSPQDHSCESPASVPTGTFSAMFRLEHFSDMFRLEHCDDMFRLEHSAMCSSRNTKAAWPNEVLGGTVRMFRLEHWTRFAHNSARGWQFDLAFETRIALFCKQLWLLDNLWDASSLLPIRRAAWARLRLPST